MWIRAFLEEELNRFKKGSCIVRCYDVILYQKMQGCVPIPIDIVYTSTSDYKFLSHLEILFEEIYH